MGNLSPERRVAPPNYASPRKAAKQRVAMGELPVEDPGAARGAAPAAPPQPAAGHAGRRKACQGRLPTTPDWSAADCAARSRGQSGTLMARAGGGSVACPPSLAKAMSAAYEASPVA